jgi:hypothetical protein
MDRVENLCRERSTNYKASDDSSVGERSYDIGQTECDKIIREESGMFNEIERKLKFTFLQN